MKWQELYSAQRSKASPMAKANQDTVRTSFIRDYDRLIFSTAFRRLQNKTQVFPLPGAVFVHNRLTHSLEVASVGRSLGKAVGEQIAQRHVGDALFSDFYQHELPSVIAAACLAHDIGNPPFGHSGEEAIRLFFTSMPSAERAILTDCLSENQLKDFDYFEGNANAFRILTHRFNEQESSYKLTYSTLASIVKYPCTSSSGFKPDTGLIATKKSGFFDSEIATYKQLATTFHIPSIAGMSQVYARHPFVFLTEAADDICYRVMDLEDAHRLGIINVRTFQDLFLPFFEEAEGYNNIDGILQKIESLKDDNQKVQYLRARWIGLMVGKLSEAFMQQEEALLAGTLQQDLLKCLPDKDRQLIRQINSFSLENIYHSRSVLEIENAGYHILGGLLKVFVHAVLHPNESRSEKLLMLLPTQFPLKKDRNHLYHDLQSVVDYVSGMTDLYALDLYRKIKGISIPEIR